MPSSECTCGIGNADYHLRGCNLAPTPNPGSDEAIRLGCVCPVMDNGHGRGSYYGRGVFIYHEGCPVHSGSNK